MIAVSPAQHATSAQRRAQAYTAACDRLLYGAWRAIAASQKRIQPHIHGGSAPDPVTERIRAALLSGALPRVNRSVWAGQAPGSHTCICCGLIIEHHEVEYAPRAAPQLSAHLRCFTTWHRESARLDQADGAAPGATAAGA